MTCKLTDHEYSLYLLGYAQGAYQQLNAVVELEMLQYPYLPVAVSMECGYESAISHFASELTFAQLGLLDSRRNELIEDIRRLAQLCLDQAEEEDEEENYHPLFA